MRSTIIALMYDFDKTLCTKDMQEFSFIPSLHTSFEEFWKESEGLARKENMDSMRTSVYVAHQPCAFCTVGEAHSCKQVGWK